MRRIAQTVPEEVGLNAYSNGWMLEGHGQGLNLDGLSEIVFIFDTKDVLAGVLMTRPGSPCTKTCGTVRVAR
jgi:hypothetical protein